MSKGVGEMVRSRSVRRRRRGDGSSPEGDRSARRGAAGEAGPLAPGQRWSVGRKRRGAAAAARRIAGGAVAAPVEIYRLRTGGTPSGLERGLQPASGPRGGWRSPGEAAHRGAVEIGCCVSARAAEQRRPLAMRTVAAMSATLSEATAAPLRDPARVSGVGAARAGALRRADTSSSGRARSARRGPTPTVTDATLLEAIQADLDRSPFQGEWPSESVHARLRILPRSGSRGRGCCG